MRFPFLGSTSREPLAVEENTPMAGPQRKTTEALGIGTQGGVFAPIIPAGTPLPCSASERFSTAEDGQPQLTLALFRGTDDDVVNDHLLGRFRIEGIPRATRGTPQIEVTFTVAERRISLSARDLARRRDLPIRRLEEEEV